MEEHMVLKGSETEKNLLKSFAGESEARNRYTYFSSVARKEGYEQISRVFVETADQEKEHAERFFKTVAGGKAEITATFPATKIGTTLENLESAASGEYEEWTELYPAFAKVARAEGFDKIADLWDAVCVAEKQHGKRYLGFLKNLKEGTVFKKSEPVAWRCLNCGYICLEDEAPELCPSCAHPQAYFEMLGENW